MFSTLSRIRPLSYCCRVLTTANGLSVFFWRKSSMYHITEAELAPVLLSCMSSRCFLALQCHVLLRVFVIAMQNASEGWRSSRCTEEPLEPFHQQLMRSYMARRTFWSEIHWSPVGLSPTKKPLVWNVSNVSSKFLILSYFRHLWPRISKGR